jgi:thiosulfate/3-mercaptopyruvate sulfurtransferase
MKMNQGSRRTFSYLLPIAVVLLGVSAWPQSSSEIPVIQINELLKIVQSAKTDKPLIIQVGSHVLYSQAHIPGSEYIGPAATDSGLQQLRQRMAALPRNKFIVIYCGCCPWSHCPNIKPAAEALHAMGFTNFKALYIPDNFGTDWVGKGYPTAQGG